MKKKLFGWTCFLVLVYALLIVTFLLEGCDWPSSRADQAGIKAGDQQSISVNVNGGKVDCDNGINTKDGARLSMLSFAGDDSVYIKIFSGLSVADVVRLWGDIQLVREKTSIRKIVLYLNSPGGDAFQGLALSDNIKQAVDDGFEVEVWASGIVASAAVPIFAVCTKRYAAPSTVFMVHEAALWKWPGRETASDIRSQNDLMKMLHDLYIGILVGHSTLTKAEWVEMEGRTTWFSAQQAKEWGLVDDIK